MSSLYLGEQRVALTERECRTWIAVLRNPPYDVRRKRTVERIADEMERAVEAAVTHGITLENGDKITRQEAA